ncbi:Mu transposase C-terminal domain-containing protein [Dongia sp.]|uniref:Mu transposase C-terminal domain-containing protein n=1 Tax=Dongia sp. TaxID=1977262 RepID=UPI0035AE13CB
MLSLNRGDQIDHQSHIYDFTHVTNNGDYCFKSLQNGTVLNQTLNEVEKAFVEGRLQCSLNIGKTLPNWREIALKSDFLSRPFAHRQIAFRRKAYCDAIIEAGEPAPQDKAWPIIIARVAAERNETPPNWETVKRWAKPYKSRNMDIRALLPGYGARGRKRKQLSSLEERFLSSIISRYQVAERPTMEEIVKEVRDRYAEAIATMAGASKWKAPSASTIRRRIKELDPYETTLQREGEAAARQKFQKRGKGFQPSRRLELVEIDHTRADVMVVDEERKAFLGRPWICWAICKRTRMIVGLYIGFHPPGTESIMQCLRNMIMPKTYVQEEFPELGLTWDAYGIPAAILVDNAQENHSESLKAAAACFNVEIRYAPVGRPEFKGTLERLNGTFATSGYTWMPGKTFGSISARRDYDPAKHACITLKDFRRHVHSWLLAMYCNATHRGINAVPAMRWAEEVQKYPVRLPANVKDIDLLLGISKEYSVSNTGIEIAKLTYQSDELNLIHRAHPNQKVVVKRNPDNVAKIVVVHPVTHDLVVVPCTNPHAHGVSFHQHACILAAMKADGVEHMNQEVYRKARIAHYDMAVAILNMKRSSAKSRAQAARKLSGSNTIQAKSLALHQEPELDPDLEQILAENAPVPMTKAQIAGMVGKQTAAEPYSPKPYKTRGQA